jgi:hypothetical protein
MNPYPAVDRIAFRKLAFLCVFVFTWTADARAEETDFVSPAAGGTVDLVDTGDRPYELDWAKRFDEDHPPLVDFEELRDWTIQSQRGEAAWTRSQQQRIWGDFVGKLTYSGDPEKGGSRYLLRPPQPIPVSAPFDSVSLWVWNDYWAWSGDRGKPQERLSVLLETADGNELEIEFPRGLDWPQWFLIHAKLNRQQRDAVSQGARLIGIRLSRCLRPEERTIYLDNLAFYQEPLDPIPTAPQPRPNLQLAENQDYGVQSAQSRLPFPTRNETLLPENLTDEFDVEVIPQGENWLFRYRGADGTLEYVYAPQSGDLGDVSIRWQGETPMRPLVGGGVRLATADEVEGLLNWGGVYIPREPKAVVPETIRLIDCKRDGDSVISQWRVENDSQSAEVTYTFRLWGKSLVVDVHCQGGEVAEVHAGAVQGVANPRLVKIPYWTGEDLGAGRDRPAVLVIGDPKEPLFLTTFLDHYHSGASQLFFRTGVDETRSFCAGGSRYLPRTDGRRNDCFERIFVTLSPRFEEVLPTIANPPSRWRNEAAEYLVCHHGARDREEDYAHWRKIKRYGMEKIVVLDHEVGWRDTAESFTFRTVPAPGKGGDQGQRRYADRMRELGFRYGLYNNYTDLSPLNEHWDEDMVGRLPDGQWQMAWYRCYAPKPGRVAAIEKQLTPVIQDKFQLRSAYCDVHTAVTPWRRVDYDARIPGAGTLRGQFYAFGQLMLHQQDVWNGPVYSEGGNHYYYAGLITGNKSDDRGYHLVRDPWLVDFDLRKLHPLGCDVGFGKRNSFAEEMGKRLTTDDWDRFLAGTIAYGHVGEFFNSPGRITPLMFRSYFMLQQLQSVYATAEIQEIRYANDDGELLDTSQAIATDAFRRSQLRLTYDNGLTVWVNGHLEENWQTPNALLPPGGYFARSADGSLEVANVLSDGHRIDRVHSTAYDYIDGRGKMLVTDRGAANRQLIILKRGDGSSEVIPHNSTRFAVAVNKPPRDLVALDEAGAEVGPARGDMRDGLYFITPVEGAVSYRWLGEEE